MLKKYLLENSEFIQSSNYDERPKNIEIDSIIIHCISLPESEFNNDNVTNLFLNKLNYKSHPSFTSLKNVRVSSHLFIKRTGEIIQFVPFDKRAWHAGVSEYKGRKNFNDFSIGIELHGSISEQYTEKQYQALNYCISQLKELFPSIQDSNILGHNEISSDRKYDPGPNFIWSKIK
ncbi:MAG: 1,6-anhydro-N-acetylmuramyl-L-alanine amidase AmpD [Gammaproteobacteria bacterium]